MIISKDAKNTFDKIQHLFPIKSLIKQGIGGKFVKLIKATVKLTLRRKAFLISSGTRKGCPRSPFKFIIALDILACAMRQEKEIKDILNRKKQTLLIHK